MSVNKNKRRVITIIVLTMIILAWTFVNADGFILPAFLYLVLGALSIFLISAFDKFGKKIKFQGIDDNIGKDILIGVIFGVTFIIIQSFNIIGSVLVPYIPASLVQDLGLISIIVIGAGVMESVFFFALLLPIFDEKLSDYGINLPFIIAGILTAVLFAFYHFTAYGQSSAQLGSFISAGILAFAWVYLYKYTNSIIPLIVSHMIINFYIINNTAHYISI